MEISQNKMATMPIRKLLITMSIPIMVSMLIEALYNVVDSLFISRIPEIGEAAITGITLAFPIQMLMISISVGTGIGINATLARTLGENNTTKKNSVVSNGILVGFFSYAAFLLFGLLASNVYIASQSSDTLIQNLGVDYLSIVTIFSGAMFLQINFENMLQATGRTTYTMITQGTGAIINIILDPILIFGKLGLPEMGIQGAAYATVIGQLCACLLALYFNKRRNPDISIQFRNIRPNIQIIGEIYKIGFPAMLGMSLASVMTYGMNIILNTISSTAVAAYGIGYRIQNFIYMPVYGLANALIPIVAFNYGIQNKKRIKGALKYALRFGLLLLLAGMIITLLGAHSIFGLFNSSNELTDLGVRAIRIMSLGYLFVSINLVAQTYLQALDKGHFSLVISMMRMIIIVLPIAYLLSILPNNTIYVWAAIPIAEFIAMLFTILLIKNVNRKKIDVLPDY